MDQPDFNSEFVRLRNVTSVVVIAAHSAHLLRQFHVVHVDQFVCLSEEPAGLEFVDNVAAVRNGKPGGGKGF